MTIVAYCKNSVQYMPPDGFFGIQTVQNSTQLPPHHFLPTQHLRRLAVKAIGVEPQTFELWLCP